MSTSPHPRSRRRPPHHPTAITPLQPPIHQTHHPTTCSNTPPPKKQNQFDAVDLSDNAVVRIEGFPRLPRLKVLYLNNNRVSKIARNLQGEFSTSAHATRRLVGWQEEQWPAVEAAAGSTGGVSSRGAGAAAAVADGRSGPSPAQDWCTVPPRRPSSKPVHPCPSTPPDSIGNLETLILTNNRIAELKVRGGEGWVW